MRKECTIFHNPRCTKSRQALALLKENGIEIEVREYLKSAPTKEELKVLLAKLHLKAEDIVRKSEAFYKEKLKGMSLSEEEWIQVFTENPILIERPIVISGNRAVVARPPEKVLELLNTL
jgi:arsenate reductase (glutaredoxin)